MARARNIKPAFFKNELLVELHAYDRLLFIGLWCLADREGRVEDRHKRIKMELFPCDTYDVDHGLNELSRCNFIKRYVAGGVSVIEIANFLKHQTPHGSEKDSELPDESGELTVNERNNAGYITGKKRRNNVNFDSDNGQAPDKTSTEPVDPPDQTTLNPESLILNPDSLNPELNAVPPSPKARRKQQLPVDFFPNELGQSAAIAKGLSVANEFQRFHDYHVSKGNVMADWQAAWRTWVGNARTPVAKAESFAERDERIASERYREATGQATPKPMGEVIDISAPKRISK